MSAATSASISHFFTVRQVFARLLEPHPSAWAQGARFVEESRGERLSNLLRFVFAVLWLGTTASYIPGNPTSFNVINMVSGGILLLVSLSYHLWLSHRPYREAYKYVLTGIDMLVSGGMLYAYAVVAGPVFVIKSPLYLAVLCCVGLAALRVHRFLAVYAGTLGIAVLVGLWALSRFGLGLEYGTRFEHVHGDKVNFAFLFDTFVFIVAFALLTGVAAHNIRRQFDLRWFEAGRAAREEERALMAAGLAHEIRNPLGAIYGFAQLLRDEPGGTPRYKEAILEDVRRLNGVVDGFLQFARPFPVRPVVVDLTAFLADFCATESLRAADHPVVFSDGPPSLPISTEPEAVRQILMNLVRNARRFQTPGGPVRLSLSGDPRLAELCVEDDGPGVDPALAPRLFIPFQSTGGEGTGLGLALSRKIAREIGGDLAYEPRARGARFRLTLTPFTLPTARGQGA